MSVVHLKCDNQNKRFVIVEGKAETTTLQNLVNYINTGYNNKTIIDGKCIIKDIETEYSFIDTNWNKNFPDQLIIKFDNADRPLFTDMIEILDRYVISSINNINTDKIKKDREKPKALTTFTVEKPAKQINFKV